MRKNGKCHFSRFLNVPLKIDNDQHEKIGAQVLIVQNILFRRKLNFRIQCLKNGGDLVFTLIHRYSLLHDA